MKTTELSSDNNNQHFFPSHAPSSLSARVMGINKEIVKASKNPGWRNYLTHTGFTPDYSIVRSGLQNLFDEGQFDEIVKLGSVIQARGQRQLENSDDDGETFQEIAETLKIVYLALQSSSLSNEAKMRQAINWELADNFSFTDGLTVFWNHTFTKKDWSNIADYLLKKLRRMPLPDGNPDFNQKFMREKIMYQVINALDHAGRSEEKLNLCMREAPHTDNYERVVTLLIEAGKQDEAVAWIHRGIEAIGDRYPGIASALERQLREIQALPPP